MGIMIHQQIVKWGKKLTRANRIQYRYRKKQYHKFFRRYINKNEDDTNCKLKYRGWSI